MALYFSYLFFLICSFLAIYITGRLLMSLFGLKIQKTYTGIFASLLTGSAFTVLLTSVYFTGGRTVNLGLLVAGILFLLLYFKNGKKQLHIESQDLERHPKGFYLLPFIVMTVIFSLRFYLIYNPGSLPFVPNLDTLFYANVSNYLGQSGIENVSLDYLKSMPAANDPYHYFDIWFNTAIINIFHLNSLTTYYLITNTIFLTCCWCGFMAITECFAATGITTVLLSFSYIFFSGIYFSFFKGFHLLENSNVFSVDVFYYHKLAVVLVFMQAAVVLYLNKRITESYLVMLVIPVVFISSSVSIFLVAGLFLFKKIFIDKDYRFGFQGGLMLVLLAGFIFVFYTFGNKSANIEMRSTQGGFLSLLNAGYLKTSVNIIGLTCIQFFIIYLPSILVFLPSARFLKPFANPFKNDLILLCVLLFFVSLCSWAAMHYLVDTVQLFSNITIVMMSVLTFVIVVFISEKISLFHRLMLNGVVFFVFVIKIITTINSGRPAYPQSSDYLNKTADRLVNINPVGVYLLNDSSYAGLFARNPIFNIAGRHLAYVNSNTFLYSLSVYNAPVTDHPERDKIAMSLAGFYHFVEQQKMEGRFKRMALSQAGFIHKYKIEYLIAERGAEPDSIFNNFITSEISDPRTGEHFYVLDYKKAGGFTDHNQP